MLQLFILFPLIAAESFVYVHPVNPKLHPKEMFPIQRGTKGFGKVRDLPPSGIVYLDRIKPIGDDFRGSALARANNTFVIGEAAIPLPEPKTEVEKVLDSDTVESSKAAALPMDFDSDLKTPPSPVTTSTSRPTTTAKLMLRHRVSLGRQAPQHEGSTLLKPKRNEQKSATVKIVKRPKNAELSDEAERHLEQLLSELKAQEEIMVISTRPDSQMIQVDLIEKNPAVPTIDVPKSDWKTGRRVQVQLKPKAKLVTLTRSASVHTGELLRKPSKGKLVQLRKKKAASGLANSAGPRRGAEFDPWERMGQM